MGKKISNVFPIILRKVKWDIRKKKTNQLQVCYATQIYSTLGINQLEQLELIRLQLWKVPKNSQVLEKVLSFSLPSAAILLLDLDLLSLVII